MLYLGVECSHQTGTLCLQKDQTRLAQISWKQERSHAEIIISKLYDLLIKYDISLKEIDSFCINRGPGSFTGIRIGVNIIKTLSYVFKKPVAGLCSHDIIAHAFPKNDKTLTVAINAHSSLNYVASFKVINSVWTKTEEIKLLSLESLKSIILKNKNDFFIGDSFSVYKDKFPKLSNATPNLNLLSAIHLVSLARQNMQSDTSCSLSWENLSPFYLRLSAPEEKFLSNLDQGSKKK